MESKPGFALLLLAAFSLLAFLPSAFAYSDHSLSVSILLREDGGAHVTERVVFTPDNENETEESNFILSTAGSLPQLARLSQNVRYHVGNATIPRANIRVTVRPAYEVASNARTIILEYDLGAIVSNKTKGRVTNHFFSQDVLEFEKNAARQMTLGPITDLSVEIPQGARFSAKSAACDGRVLAVRPDPDSVSGNVVLWSGKNIGPANWCLQYEREIPLSQEVYEYFLGLYEKASASAPLIILAALMAVVLLVLVKFGRPKAEK